jgi:hypothetical protein
VMDFKCEVPLFSSQRLGNEIVKIGLESNGVDQVSINTKGKRSLREISATATAPVSGYKSRVDAKFTTREGIRQQLIYY